MPIKKPRRTEEEKEATKNKRNYMLREDTILQIDDLKRVYKVKYLSDIMDSFDILFVNILG